MEKLQQVYQTKQLQFFGQHQALKDKQAFDTWCQPFKKQEWVVYAKRPFAGPEAVLQYLSRYTHRVAIANSRLIHFDQQQVTFKVKDYRRKKPDRYTAMTLAVGEFMRRFLLHVLPNGFHRIRHYGLLTNTQRVKHLTKIREYLHCAEKENPKEQTSQSNDEGVFVCPHCNAPMVIIEIFDRGHAPRAPPNKAA
jgi:Zn finger protein HypA/HybF involved in hydrogenase expression